MIRPTIASPLLGALLLGAFFSSTVRCAEISWPSHQWGEANNAPVMLELKKKFEEENPGHTVRNITIPQAAFFDKQFADVAAGNPADVATLYDPDIRAYIEADLLEPLDDYYATAGINIDTLIPTRALAQKNGKIYGVPFQINARALFYNEKLLQDVGLQPPKDFAEFQSAIRKLRKPEAQQFGYATVSKPGNSPVFYVEIMPIVVGFGGGFFKDGAPNATAPETIAALKFLKSVYDEQLIPRGMEINAFRQMFIEGKIGMYATGGFFAGSIANGNKETFANLNAIPLPFPSGKTIAITVFLSVPKAAKNKELAARLLLRMLKDGMQQTIVAVGKTVPGRVGMIPTGFVQENRWFRAFERAALTATSYAPQGVEQYGGEIVKIVVEHVEEMLFKNTPVEESAGRLQKALGDFIATQKNG
jgi:multiple sugar transport system substrate-binding protein